MFDVSDRIYITSPLAPIQLAEIHLLFAYTANFLIFLTKILIFSINSTPFFFVWVASIFIWFFLEMTTNIANLFNLKHSNQYRSATHHLNITLTLSKLLFKNKNILVKLFYKIIL